MKTRTACRVPVFANATYLRQTYGEEVYRSFRAAADDKLREPIPRIPDLSGSVASMSYAFITAYVPFVQAFKQFDETPKRAGMLPWGEHGFSFIPLALALALASPTLGATPICRWVDESGRTQLAQVVPEKYRKIAICTESQRFELSRQQRQAAERRAVEDRNRAKKTADEPPVEQASGSLRRPGALSQPGAKRPTEVVTEATDCPTWWRIYDESVECFGPYRTTRGATKREAFDNCNVIASPEPKCGPRSR